MSAGKVDVLAVMDALAGYAKLRGGNGCESQAVIVKARASVAEMIADLERLDRLASLAIRYHSTGLGYAEEMQETIRAALVRVQP